MPSADLKHTHTRLKPRTLACGEKSPVGWAMCFCKAWEESVRCRREEGSSWVELMIKHITLMGHLQRWHALCAGG